MHSTPKKLLTEQITPLPNAQLLPLYQAIPDERRIEFEISNNIQNPPDANDEDAAVTDDEVESEALDDEIVSNVSAVSGHAEAELDAELRSLQKRRDILLLKQQLRILEQGEAAANVEYERVPLAIGEQLPVPLAVPVVVAPPSNRRADFRDVEHAIVKFTGDEPSHDVHEFLCDYEEVMRIAHADETLKLLGLRRSLLTPLDCWCNRKRHLHTTG